MPDVSSGFSICVFYPYQSLESDDGVAKIDEVAGKLSVLYKLSFVILGWLAAISVYLALQHGDIQAIKQSINDHGLGQIVTELKAPKSRQQLQANLSTVIAQVQTARANGKQPDPKKVTAISEAVSQVTQKDPEVPEAWQAASALVSFRNAIHEPSNSIPCEKPYSVKIVMLGQHFDPTGPASDVLQYRDCVMDIGDLTWFEKNDPTPHGAQAAISLTNVHVIYRGGPLLPVRYIVFSGCTFEFQINAPPPQPGRALTQTLLAASDINNVTFNLPTATHS
jgi:hypothetical protein